MRRGVSPWAAELLVLIREFDERTGWSGCTSCAHWLSWRTGLAPGAAREHVRVARALGNLPKLSDAMRRGIVSYSKVRAVTRVAAPETEQALLNVALCGTAGDRYQMVVHVDADALVANSGEPRRSEMVRRPNERTAGAAARGGRGAAQEDVPAGTSAASYAPGRPGGVTQMSAGSALGEGNVRRAQLRTSARCSEKAPATSAARALSAPSQTVLDEAGGIHVAPETARRVACDSATVTMRHGPGGEILDVGRRTRTISPALRRALASRDGQCRFPGCQNRRCDSHHVQHWADGGATALDNLVLLCRRHHRSVHEEGFRVTFNAAGEVQFMRPDGRRLLVAPPAPAWSGLPLAPVTARLEQEEIAIGPNTATPAWRGERLDLHWAISVLWRPRTASGHRRS